jgi:hypothetical protein
MTVLGGSFLGDETEQRVDLLNAARRYNSCIISCPAIQNREKATWVFRFRRIVLSMIYLHQWIFAHEM